MSHNLLKAIIDLGILHIKGDVHRVMMYSIFEFYFHLCQASLLTTDKHGTHPLSPSPWNCVHQSDALCQTLVPL